MLIGLDKHKSNLMNLIPKNSTSIILNGQNGIGKFSLVSEVLKELVSNESNIHVLKSEEGKSSINIEQLRDLFEVINVFPYGDSRHYIVIDDAEQMNDVTFNTLLKRLEEPKQTELFILVTSNLDNLSATIKSRCLVVNIDIDADVLQEHLSKVDNEVIRKVLFKKGFATIFDYLENATTSSRYNDCYNFVVSLFKETNIKNIAAHSAKFNSNLDINLEMALALSSDKSISNVDSRRIYDLYSFINRGIANNDILVDILIYRIISSNNRQ